MENKSIVATGTAKDTCGSDLKCVFHAAIHPCQSQPAPRSLIAIKFDALIMPVFTIAASEWPNHDDRLLLNKFLEEKNTLLINRLV